MNNKLKSFLIIYLLFIIFLSFYFFFYSNNKYSSSFLYEKKLAEDHFFMLSNKKSKKIVNKIFLEIPTLALTIEEYKNDIFNQFLSEGFLCLQENKLYLNEYQNEFKNIDKNLIKSLSLQGGYFYDRKQVDKVLIKFSHSSPSNLANQNFFNYFNFCFIKSYEIHNITHSYFKFLELELKKYKKDNLIYELNRLPKKNIKIKNFNYLIKPYKTGLNYYYYLSLICFGFTLCVLLNSIFFSFLIKKTK
jgi:hypothetical protein